MSQRRAESAARPDDRAGVAPEGRYRVGFDVGGTFTDFVVQSPDGQLHTGKRLTSYPDPSEACLAGLGSTWRDAYGGLLVEVTGVP